jgi:methionine biosynthesis protein MetW
MNLRPDHNVIADMIPQNATALDIGCGEGEMLTLLAAKNVRARGLEIDHNNVSICLKKGLSVLQGDVDIDLAYYPENAFDYAILTQVLQVTKFPDKILLEVLRVAKYALVSIPNFGYWANRAQLLLNGRMPVTKKLSYEWYETPNIHFCTIRDFVILCENLGLKIEKKLAIKPNGRIISFNKTSAFANLQGELGVFLISK